MKKYDSSPPGAKSWKDTTVKIRHRLFGSTHASPTKERIVRNGKKRARRKAKAETKNDLMSKRSDVFLLKDEKRG